MTGLQSLLEVETSGKNEQELVIYDPVGLPGSHSLFEVWSGCFLALLFVCRLCSPSKATEGCFWQIFYSDSMYQALFPLPQESLGSRLSVTLHWCMVASGHGHGLWTRVKVWSRPQNLITKLHPAIPFQSSPVHSIPPFQSTESIHPCQEQI